MSNWSGCFLSNSSPNAQEVVIFAMELNLWGMVLEEFLAGLIFLVLGAIGIAIKVGWRRTSQIIRQRIITLTVLAIGCILSLWLGNLVWN